MKLSNNGTKPISFILLAIILGVNYLLIKIIENIPLRITLIIVVNIIICFIYFVIMADRTIKDIVCPFHNDERLFYGTGANPDIWYRDAHFCSVADPINVSFEVVNGEKRYVSATNKFLSCCMNRGAGCPFFQKFSMMSEDKLREFYKSKWYQEYERIQSQD